MDMKACFHVLRDLTQLPEITCKNHCDSFITITNLQTLYLKSGKITR